MVFVCDRAASQNENRTASQNENRAASQNENRVVSQDENHSREWEKQSLTIAIAVISLLVYGKAKKETNVTNLAVLVRNSVTPHLHYSPAPLPSQCLLKIHTAMPDQGLNALPRFNVPSFYSSIKIQPLTSNPPLGVCHGRLDIGAFKGSNLMLNPFPGMNPYLEQPEYWSDFHNQLVASLARALVPKLLPKYRVVTDKCIYKLAGPTSIAVGRPDVTVQRRANAPILTTTVAVSQPSVQPIKVTVPLLEEVRQSYIEVRDVATQDVVTALEVLSPANKRGEGRKKYEAKR